MEWLIHTERNLGHGGSRVTISTSMHRGIVMHCCETRCHRGKISRQYYVPWAPGTPWEYTRPHRTESSLIETIDRSQNSTATAAA